MTADSDMPARAMPRPTNETGVRTVNPPNFLCALLLFWLLPSLIGPRVMRQSLARAIAAFHIAAITLLACPIIAAAIQESAPNYEPWRMRESACLYIFNSIARAQAIGWTESPLLVIALVLSGVFVAAPAVAGLLTPWCSDPAQSGSAFLRALKLHFWSATILLPASIAVAATIIPFGKIYLEPYGSYISNLSGPSPTLWPVCSHTTTFVLSSLASATIVLYLRGLTMGAAPRANFFAIFSSSSEDRFCLQCGYCLRGLPENSRCPECGNPDAFGPPGKNISPDLDLHDHRSTLRNLLAIHRDVLLGRTPPAVARFEIHAMREFWWRSIYLFIVVEILLLAMLVCIQKNPRQFVDAIPWLVGGSCILPTLVLMAVMDGASLSNACARNRTPQSVTTAICFYLCPLLWPTLLLPPVLFHLWRNLDFVGLLPAPAALGLVLAPLVAWFLWFFLRVARLRGVFASALPSSSEAPPSPDVQTAP